MTTAEVVETSVSVNNNSPIQDYVQPDDQTQPTSVRFVARDQNITGCQGNASVWVIENVSEAGRGLSFSSPSFLAVRDFC